MRELKAFGRMESSKFSPRADFTVQPLPRGYVGAGGFVLSAENAADVAEICRRLDGLTLELAAARCKLLTLAEMLGTELWVGDGRLLHAAQGRLPFVR